jgi:hypothetical protein
MNDLSTQQRLPAFDLSPQTFEQALTFSQYLADSDLVPKDFKGKPANCLIAMQWGAELGLKPLQALQNLAIINGRPSLWGDAVIALVRGSPLCESVLETDDGTTATCRVKRRGEAEQVRTFSMDDAKAAGLMGKAGPWTQYPKRMRQMRARAFALRDIFPDVLRGMPIAEEVMDTPAERFMGNAEVVTEQKPAGWPADTWEARLTEWRKAIAAGRATAEAVIAKAQTKHVLTEAQKKAIRAPAKSAAPAVTSGEVSQRIADATDVDSLNEAAALIDAIADEAVRVELNGEYDDRLAALTA